MKQYLAKLDTLAKMLTAGVLLLLAFEVYHIGRKGLAEPWIWVVLIALGLTFLFTPSWYAVNTAGIEINRFLNTKLIPIDEIIKVTRVHSGELGGGLRVFGSGGFMGYLGIFWYSSAGWVRAHCTDRSKLVMITTNKRKYLVSPNEPEDFIENANRMILSKTSR